MSAGGRVVYAILSYCQDRTGSLLAVDRPNDFPVAETIKLLFITFWRVCLRYIVEGGTYKYPINILPYPLRIEK